MHTKGIPQRPSGLPKNRICSVIANEFLTASNKEMTLCGDVCEISHPSTEQSAV